MKNAHVAIVAAFALTGISAAGQDKPGYPITVKADSSSRAVWAAQLGSSLDDILRKAAPPVVFGRGERSGIVRVRFECGANGRPEHVRLLQANGDIALDHHALRAVSKLDLHPLPGLVGRNEVVQANIIYASGERQFAQLSRKLRRIEQARLAKSPQERAVLAISNAGLARTS